MEIQERKLSEIIPYENNPRHNDEAVDKVAASLQEFGWQQPIVVDTEGIVIAGHTRLRAAQKLGMESAPVIVAEDLTEEQTKAYRLADNKTAEFSGWDFDLLNAEIFSIDQIDMSQFGFDMAAFTDSVLEAEEDDFDVASDKEEPKVQNGEIWKLGGHRLMCGDSTEEKEVEKLMDGLKADMVITDPPYGVEYTGGIKIENGKIKSNEKEQVKNDDLNYKGLFDFLKRTFENIKLCSEEKAALYIFYAHSRSREFLNAFDEAGLKRRSIIIWHKISGGFGDFMAQYMNAYEPCIYGSNGESVNWYGPNNEKTVWEMAKEKKCDLHPTMKPVELMARAIRNSSKSGDVVMDLFGGSGTTLIACEQLKRKCYMMEMDPHYCDVIIERWEQLTGRKAERDGSESNVEKKDPGSL